MSIEDDDIPQLPADTLALLAQFQQEQQKRAELEQSGEADVGEDWQVDLTLANHVLNCFGARFTYSKFSFL